ncbi:MAG: EamA family transporter [archaeon]|nr:EamA family transporter [archaeon]
MDFYCVEMCYLSISEHLSVIKGVRYVLLVQTCFALIGVFTRYIGSSMDTFAIVFFRVFIAALFFLALAFATKNLGQLSVKKEDIKPFFFSG